MIKDVRRWPGAAVLLVSSLSSLTVLCANSAAQPVLPSSSTDGRVDGLEVISNGAELPTANELRSEPQSSHLLSQTPDTGNTAPNSQESSSPLRSPTRDRLLIGIGDPNARWSFSYGFGSKLGEPNALQGPTRVRTVSTSGQRAITFPIAGFAEQRLGTGRRLLLESLIDPQVFGAELSFAFLPTFLPGLLGINVQNQSARAGAFENGDDRVDLPSGADPWVNRIGGGLEYFQPLTDSVDIAGGMSYQVVSVREGMFTPSVSAVDELGNRVTVSDDGIDPLLTVNVATVVNALDDRSFPTAGTRLRLGLDQSIPVGDASITMSRLSANWSQYIPLNGAGDERRAHTLIVNVQGGDDSGGCPTVRGFFVRGSLLGTRLQHWRNWHGSQFHLCHC